MGAPKAEIVDAGDLVDELRWVKDDDEIRIMRRAMYFADVDMRDGHAARYPAMITFKIEQDGNDYHAWSPQLPGCHTFGHTRAEALAQPEGCGSPLS